MFQKINYYKNSLKKNGFVVKKFPNDNFIKQIEKTIKKIFYRKEDYYLKISLKKFHNIAIKCQASLNKLKIQKKFNEFEKNFLDRIFDEEKILYSVDITLRVVRPKETQLNNKKNQKSEALGWHRETFYGNHKHIKYSYNFWMPVLNYSKKICLNYIPRSHLIPDDLIIRKKCKVNDNKVIKFSDSHKLGFPYSPKEIISGVKISKGKKIFLPRKYYLLFSQMLVHGNGKNFSKKIRFAVNFSMVPKNKLIRNKKINKRKFDFVDTSNGNLFVEF
jgi:ectoine hydroxylase-related dioxygenase (phytanoyl-CoA dioxygenase family)